MFMRYIVSGLLIACTGFIGSGCGMIADKGLIVIATIDGKKFTRNDLRQLIYDMDDAERPRIESRSDLVRVIRTELDNQIKIPLGKQLAEEGRVKIDRNMARELFFMQSGEDGNSLRQVYAMELHPDGKMTPLQEEMGMTPERIRTQKDLIELATDKVLDAMQGEQAVMVLANEAFAKGEMQLSEDLLKSEYELRKAEYMQFEWLKFAALRFPVSEESSSVEVAGVLDRIRKGEKFDAVYQEYKERDPGLVVESEIENNPAMQRFRSFWEQASGAQVGQIVGPVHMPTYNQVAIDAEGNQRSVTQEAVFMVLKVLDHRDPEPMSIEEALPKLEPGLRYVEMMERLRKEHGVEIYEDKIPDPSLQRGGTGGVPFAAPPQQG